MEDISGASDFEEILTPDEIESLQLSPPSQPSSVQQAGRTPAPRPQRQHRPSWDRHGDKLVGIVDMGR